MKMLKMSKKNIKLYIESKIINSKNTIRDLNMFVKMTYEYNKNKFTS